VVRELGFWDAGEAGGGVAGAGKAVVYVAAEGRRGDYAGEALAEL
jgi:hypothetical protein